MKALQIAEILEATAGTLLAGDEKEIIIKVKQDSREAEAKALFVPIVGETMDGHRFLESALDQGFSAAFCGKREVAEVYLAKHPNTDKALILVDDTLKALQNLGRYTRKIQPIPAVGVTGSVGKTTTREMISLALSAQREVYRTTKNFNNRIGLPLTLLDIPEDKELAVLELGMYVPGELGTISALANLDAAVITNIGVAHIEFYGSQEKIAQEKLTIAKGFWPENPHLKKLFLNGDDPFLVALQKDSSYENCFYGTQENATYQARNIRMEQGKNTFDLYVRNQYVLTLSLSVLGLYNVLNACAALAVADFFQVDLKKAAEKLATYTGVKGRLFQIEKDGILYIDDTYNASPQSMVAGLDVLCMAKETHPAYQGRKIAVLGDMFELGEKAPDFHFEVGKEAAKRDLQMLFLIGENAKEIARGAKEQHASFFIQHVDTHEELVDALKQAIQPQDILYFKASNGMKLGQVVERFTHES